jgi:hypothetical protein
VSEPGTEEGAGPPALFERVLRAGREDDPACAELLARFTDPELVGELIVELYRARTPAARAAVLQELARPFRRGYWQGFKRVFKLVEQHVIAPSSEGVEVDLELWVAQARTLDAGSGTSTWPVSPRTVAYLHRRCYRALKLMAVHAPDRFQRAIRLLIAGQEGGGRGSALLVRVLREVPGETQDPMRFVARLENPFVEEDANSEAAAGMDMLELSPDELTRATDAQPGPAPSSQGQQAPPWKGPIFWELWVRDPAWLLDLLGETRDLPAVRVIARLLREKVGERLMSVPLDRFYQLLEHPEGDVWRLALGQLAARARQELLRFGDLVPLLRRAREAGPDWAVIADLLYVFDDERAEAEREGLTEDLRDLLVSHPDATGVGPVVTFLRGHLDHRLGAPLFDWASALPLIEARRPDVRELGRDVAGHLADATTLDAKQIDRLLASSLPDDAPDLVHRILTGTASQPQGYRPRQEWPLDRCARSLDRLPQPGFDAARRAILTLDGKDHDGTRGLQPEVGQSLIKRGVRRTRVLGLELFGAALRRGRVNLLGVVDLLAAEHEDVVVWAHERVEEAAAKGGLSNEALYRMLDAAARDVQGFARRLVRQHLRNFEVAELIVFCAESPDATTAELGISLYEQELKDSAAFRAGHDLARLLPMFRILLYKVATARREKERLYGTLRRWALEAASNARLVVDVVAAFRRTQSKLDFEKVVRLLVEIDATHPDVKVPFTSVAAFGSHLGQAAGRHPCR